MFGNAPDVTITSPKIGGDCAPVLGTHDLGVTVIWGGAAAANNDAGSAP